MRELQARLISNIKESAKRKKITLTHIPDRAGSSRTHFWDVLAGRKAPTIGWVEDIAKALEIDPGELFKKR